MDNGIHKVLRKFNILNSKHTDLSVHLSKFEVNQRYQFVYFLTNQNSDTNHRNYYI